MLRRFFTVGFTPCMRAFSATPISSEEVESTVYDILKRFDKVDINKFSKTASFEEMGLDSLDSVEAVVALEDRFKFDLADEEALKILKVDQAVAAVLKRVNS
jgi:NADH dehydrogenase (ubiquinone) 1 alpha/beta subcomplex 1